MVQLHCIEWLVIEVTSCTLLLELGESSIHKSKLFNMNRSQLQEVSFQELVILLETHITIVVTIKLSIHKFYWFSKRWSVVNVNRCITMNIEKWMMDLSTKYFVNSWRIPC